MSAINPLYGFLGRSSRACAMYLPHDFTALQTVVQAGLQLGSEDPTSKHLAAYAERLQRIAAGLPSDAHGFYGAQVDRLYVKTESGLAFIPVWGMLFNRCGWACSYFTGYDYLQDAHAAALADSQVKAIVFDIDSYGGEAQGCMETAEVLYARRGEKPTLALANANACSAGYAVASSAERVTAIGSSNVGSVGVVLAHIDFSGYLEKNGIKVTLLHEGAHKVDGNPYTPLPEPVRKELQADLKKHMGRFVGAVARNRSMSADAVRETEARVYDGPDALGVGFIDAVEAPTVSVTAFATGLSGSSNSQEYAMTTPQQPGVQTTDPNKPAASTTPAAPAASATPSAPGTPSAADAERARIKGILGSTEAQGRTALAEHLAYQTSTPVDQAKVLLNLAPSAVPAAAKNPFEAAMDASEHPNVGASSGGDDERRAASERDNAAAELLRSYSLASGRTFDK